jgi:hypothetical protein
MFAKTENMCYDLLMSRIQSLAPQARLSRDKKRRGSTPSSHNLRREFGGAAVFLFLSPVTH